MFEKIKILMSSIWVVLKPIFIQFMTSAGQLLLDVAVDIVKDLANTDLSSSEKREAAFDRIKGELKVKGVEVKDSLINTAIEIAVQRIKTID